MKFSIDNFYQYSDSLAAGAQPTINQILELKNSGYEVIFNISPTSARNALQNEANIVENSNMHYVHFPVDCSNLQPIHFMAFSGIMNGLRDKKIFVHCGGNIKSSNLIHMYDVLENRVDERESMKILKKIQNPEEKWFDYFKSFGMEGVK